MYQEVWVHFKLLKFFSLATLFQYNGVAMDFIKVGTTYKFDENLDIMLEKINYG